jgi:hypothetical protein
VDLKSPDPSHVGSHPRHWCETYETGKEIAGRRVCSKKFDPDRGWVSGQGRRAGCFTTPAPDMTILVQTDYGRVERTNRDRPITAIGADAKEVPRQRGGLGRGYYRPSRSDLGDGVRPVYSKLYTTGPSGARGEKTGVPRGRGRNSSLATLGMPRFARLARCEYLVSGPNERTPPIEVTTTFGVRWAANPGRKIPFRPEGKIEN